ncbi:MAG: M3 family oligoendopeptidase [Patescibacteria group bacterium]
MNKIKTQWDFESFFSGSDSATEKEKKIISRENYKFINKWSNRDDYLNDPAVLKKALDEYERLNRNFGTSGNAGFYFYLKSHLDENDPKTKARFKNIQEFSIKIGNELQFFEHNIARISPNIQSRFLTYEGLRARKHFLEKLFNQAKYILSDAEEKILNLKQATSHDNWVKMVSSFLSREERVVLTEKGKKEKKNYSEIIKLMSSNKKRVRDSASVAFNDILQKYADVAENELNSILANKKINDDLRKMNRPDLARHIDDDIDSEVVGALISAVSAKFSISKKYYALKAKLMKTDRLEYHERNVEYGKLPKYSHSESVLLVNKVFANLDKKFSEILNNYATQGQIDFFPKKDKTSGAFCASNLISQPSYVLLNHSQSLSDTLTFAHEMGHAINSELQKEVVDSLNFGTPKSTAEVASTFMEDFVLEELKRDAKDETRLALMMQKLNDDVATIFRQIACYMFEKELHDQFRKKDYLPKEEIGKLFQKHMSAYMGPAVSQSSGSENWWIYWGHIRSFFYNYSYASGLLISKSMQARYAEDHSFMEKVKEFLSAGTSDSPKNIFKNMGVDITNKKFWLNGLERVAVLLKDAENLAKKLGKI